MNLYTVARPSGRAANAARETEIIRSFTRYAEGSVLIKNGHTQVICTASVLESVPSFLKGSGQGWLTAEYGMLPRATHTRSDREAAKGKQNGRTQEIQRLIGRSLRAAFDLNQLGERTLQIDCDVIQADGGTRTAAITGAMVAAYDALNSLVQKDQLKTIPLLHFVAAISVGVYRGVAVLDLDYAEDANCDSDMNIVMNEQGQFIEIQGTAEGATFDRNTVNTLLDLAAQGTQKLVQLQKASLGISAS